MELCMCVLLLFKIALKRDYLGQQCLWLHVYATFGREFSCFAVLQWRELSWPFGMSEYVILGPVVSFTTIEYWCRLLKTVWWDTPASLATSFQTLWILCSPRITSYVIWNLYLAGLRDCSTSHQNSISEACHNIRVITYEPSSNRRSKYSRKLMFTVWRFQRVWWKSEGIERCKNALKIISHFPRCD